MSSSNNNFLQSNTLSNRGAGLYLQNDYNNIFSGNDLKENGFTSASLTDGWAGVETHGSATIQFQGTRLGATKWECFRSMEVLTT